MTAPPELEAPGAYPQIVTHGLVKFQRDVWSVLEMKFLFLIRGWQWYLVRPLVFPLGVLFFLKVIVPDDPSMNQRFLVGAMVFGVSFSTANQLSFQILQDRFLGRLKLLITMPMSKASYAVGVLIFAAIQGTPGVLILLAISPFAGVDMNLTWAFFPLIVASLLGMSGIALIIASVSPSLEVGGIVSNLVGVVLVMASPVFFTMDQAPLALKIVGWVSPMRYAADGTAKAISGGGDIWVELTVLTGFAAISMALGLWKMTWREE
jgi:ABC-type multidrug transport system permease subunit